MKRTLFILLVTLFSMSGQSCKNDANKKVDTPDYMKGQQETKISEQNTARFDEDFMNEAANGSLMEIKMGNLAREKAQNPRVKNFGTMMTRDHSKTNEDLNSLASSKKISLSATIKEHQKKHLETLRKKTGNEFDIEFMEIMVDHHKTDIEKFNRAAEKSADTSLNAFIHKTIPVLQTHLDSALRIHNMLKKIKL